MTTEVIRGYKVEHYIDPEKARKTVEFYLDFGMMCEPDKNGRVRHAIMTINNTLRIRFKYEGMKREYIEIKELKKSNITEKHT